MARALHDADRRYCGIGSPIWYLSTRNRLANTIDVASAVNIGIAVIVRATERVVSC